MFDSDDSDVDVDVCTVDDETTSSFVGLTVVAAEAYIEEESKTGSVDLVPLSKEDLLTREKQEQMKEAKLRKMLSYEKKCSEKSNAMEIDEIGENLQQGSLEMSKPEGKKKQDSPPRTSKGTNKRKFHHVNTKEESTKEQDSEDEIFDSGVNNLLHKFSFESDHLAIKNNKDYHMLLQTLAVLEAQRVQAIKDFEELSRLKEKALADPLDFVTSIQEKTGPRFPERQQIAKVPEINWMHYMTAYTNDKFVPQITTRNSTKEFDQETFENDIDEYEDNTLKDAGEKALKNLERPASFNQKWSVEEQERLEQLLVMYPPEEVEARRWEKIAKALGNRTAQQVSSRIQKYFIKLARAKLPIPGRAPSSTSVTTLKKKANMISFKNSTFFPAWRPAVSMKEDGSDSFGEDMPHKHIEDFEVSDDEDIPSELKETPEYNELMELKRIKKMCTMQSQTKSRIMHRGYMCDGCSMDPIVGVRWHCVDCPSHDSVDLCNTCVKRPIKHVTHSNEHELVPVHESVQNAGGDLDYTTFEQTKFQYNYLDPNFVPS